MKCWFTIALFLISCLVTSLGDLEQCSFVDFNLCSDPVVATSGLGFIGSLLVT